MPAADQYRNSALRLVAFPKISTLLFLVALDRRSLQCWRDGGSGG